ncbi:hypothetical protein [Aliarcobacter cryaerophilus]|uniref:hypothetical protein n=1 Tax=Aliarcobacter cryaerophilus TaxID=28198 RepID=UPI0021B19E7D|nr:hypothetical protein [Aliarcobacter cryaerophilus]MCT7542925.1 hypothetical protein [Aliarcobacter cryaerophilus]
MKNITTVKELSGKFFVETKNGEIFELKIGDTIRENDIVFGSETNQAGSKIDILLENNSILTLNGLERVLFDITVLSSNLDSSIQTAFTQDQVQSLLSEPSNIDFSAWGADFVAENIDITEEETAAGEEEEVTSEGSIGTFALRDGSLVDIESDLRKKSFAKTQTFNEIEKSEELENLSLRNVAENNNNFIPPYTVTPLPNLPETGAGEPTTPPATEEPTTPPATEEPTTPPATEEPTTPEKETPTTPCATGGTFNISYKYGESRELLYQTGEISLTKLLSKIDVNGHSDILKSDMTNITIDNKYLGKNDKGEFKYNKEDYGSDKAFIIDLKDGNDYKEEEYLDDDDDGDVNLKNGSYKIEDDKNILKSDYIKEDSITNMSKSDVKTILDGVNDGVADEDKTNFLLIKVDGLNWDSNKMQSYNVQENITTEDGKEIDLTIYLDKVTFAPCENWTLQGRYDSHGENGFAEENKANNGKYLVYSPQDGSQKVVIELNELG